MTPKERVMNRLKGHPVDKIPNLNIVMTFAAKYAGVPYGKFCSDYKALVAAQEKTAVDFGLDILSTMSDPYRETSDYGANVQFQEDDLPVCEGAFLTGPEELAKLKRWDPLTSTRMLDRIRAIELFKENWGEQYPILGWIEGPWAEFNDLVTLNEGLMMLYDEPEFAMDAMEIITEQAIDCAKAQIAAGADIIGMGDAPASIINREQYCEFVVPFEKRIIQAIHEVGGKVKLHICGNINHILEDIVETGADIVDIDFMVDYKKAVEVSQGKCSINGNINPVEVILQGTTDEVRELTRLCVDSGNAMSFISGGCEVPKMTPIDNLKAVDLELQSLSSN